jgi:hypothetical protein
MTHEEMQRLGEQVDGIQADLRSSRVELDNYATVFSMIALIADGPACAKRLTELRKLSPMIAGHAIETEADTD